MTNTRSEMVGHPEPAYEYSNLKVSLFDGSEEMVYTGQMLVVNHNDVSTPGHSGKNVTKSESKAEQSIKKAKKKSLGSQKLAKNFTAEKRQDVSWSRFSPEFATTNTGFGLPSNVTSSACSSNLPTSNATCSTLKPEISFPSLPKTTSTSIVRPSTSATLGSTKSTLSLSTTNPISSTLKPEISFPSLPKTTSTSIVRPSTSATLGSSKSTLSLSTTNPISSTKTDKTTARNMKAHGIFGMNVEENDASKSEKQTNFGTPNAGSVRASIDKGNQQPPLPASQCDIVKHEVSTLSDLTQASTSKGKGAISSASTSKKPLSPTSVLEEKHKDKSRGKSTTPSKKKLDDNSVSGEFGLDQASMNQRNGHLNSPSTSEQNLSSRRKLAENSDDEVEVSGDSGIDTAVSLVDKTAIEINQSKRSLNIASLTTVEFYQNLYQAKQHVYSIQASLVKSLISELRKLETQINLKQNADVSNESMTGLHQSLVLLLNGLIKCLDIQVGLNEGLRELLDKTSNVDDSSCDADSTNEVLSVRAEDLSSIDLEAKDDLLLESRSLMNRTSFVGAFVCVHLFNPYSSDLRYSCCEDRVYSRSILECHLPHGQGRLESLSGNLIYDGQWKEGKRWGVGKAFIFSGQELSASRHQYGMYEGYWWQNMRHGHGRLVFASSAEYSGEWQYDLRSGVGTMKYADGSIYEGTWDEDVPDGCGTFTWPNGTVECREYSQGQVVRVLQLPEDTRRMSSHNETARDFSILRMKYQRLYEEKNSLINIQCSLKDSIETMATQMDSNESQLKDMHQNNVKQLKTRFRKLLHSEKVKHEENHKEEMKKIRESNDITVKDLEDQVSQLQKELNSKESVFTCQICFERERDCIILPCAHALYCSKCVASVKSDSRRCPACRGSINGQICFNINK